MFDNVRHHLTVAVQSWKDDRASARASKGLNKPSRDELAFMPAALEVLEKPASPLGRSVALSISALFLIAILWSIWGELDTHASAQSTLIPTGRTKVIQSLEMGVVKSILVSEGQSVRKGTVLIELDSTQTGADTDRFQKELMELRITAARLRALLSDAGDPARVFRPPPNAPADLMQLHLRSLRSARNEQKARMEGFRNQLAQRRNEKLSLDTNVSRLNQTLPLMEQRVSSIKKLTDKGHFPRLRYLEIQQEFIDKQKELEMQSHRRAEIDSAMAALDERMRQATAEFRRTRLDELTETERRIAANEQELIKAQQRGTMTRLTAPIDGVVQQLAVNTVGGVVQPAEKLMVIVPGDNTLQLEAKVLNRDIGFVRAGQDVEIKLETFPFTKYGTVPGKVLYVSGDAVADEKLGPVYLARISVGRKTMKVGDQQVPLTPGMAATAEIKTGKRQVIEYVISPILRYRDEALRER